MNELDRFRKAISPYWDGWQSIDIRTVCILTYEKWINIGTRVILSQDVVTAPTDLAMLPSMPNLCALHEVLDIAEFDGLLAQLMAGKLKVSDREIHFGTIEGNEVKTAPPNFQFQQARRGTSYFQGEYPYLSLVHWGQGLHNMLNNHEQAPTQDELDWKLRSLKTPYNGLEDLLLHFLEVPRPAYGGIPSVLTEVVAPLGIRLGSNSTLADGKLTVHVESSGDPKAAHVSLGVIALSGISPVNRIACDLIKDDWSGSPATVHKEIPIGTASSADIFLSWQGNALDIQTVNDPVLLLNNPRIMAFNHFDQDLIVLRGYLLGKGGDPSKDFEIGVGILFHFCGFNVGPYGRVKALQAKAIQEEIDHLVFAPSGRDIVAIECTKKDLDIDGKLSKFSRRVNEVRELLPAITVIPLVCTPLSKSIIATSDIQKADREHIGVVAAEEIQAIFEMAGQNKEPQEILEFLRGLIRKPDDMPFWST